MFKVPVVNARFLPVSQEMVYYEQRDGTEDVEVMACDLEGKVYFISLQNGLVHWGAKKKVFLTNPIGPTFTIQTYSSNLSQFVAFGSLKEVMITQIKPNLSVMRNIKRPPYIEIGIIPYIDFGQGLTPTYRDKVYDIIALAWGRTLQLAIITSDN